MEKFKDLKFKNDYQTREALEAEMESVIETIKQGKIYATVVSVAKSGMSRRIKFYRINQNIAELGHWQDSEEPNYEVCSFDNAKEIINGAYIENITAHIGWIRGYMPIGQYKQGAKYVNDDGLLVGGCGMDMIFHTLYNCMAYSEAKEWNQHYRTL